MKLTKLQQENTDRLVAAVDTVRVPSKYPPEIKFKFNKKHQMFEQYDKDTIDPAKETIVRNMLFNQMQPSALKLSDRTRIGPVTWKDLKKNAMKDDY